MPSDTDRNDARPEGDWAAAHRRYWEAWEALWQASRAPGGGDERAPAWRSGLELWLQAVQAALPVEMRTLFVRLLPAADAYARISTELDALAAALKDTDGPQRAARLRSAQARLTAQVEAMQRDFVAQVLGVVGLPPSVATDPVAAGPRAGPDLAAALTELGGLWGEMAQDAAQHLLGRLEAMGDGGNAPDARALYDVWIDCCEQAYAETVRTERYARAWGRALNGVLAWQRSWWTGAAGAALAPVRGGDAGPGSARADEATARVDPETPDGGDGRPASRAPARAGASKSRARKARKRKTAAGEVPPWDVGSLMNDGEAGGRR